MSMHCKQWRMYRGRAHAPLPFWPKFNFFNVKLYPKTVILKFPISAPSLYRLLVEDACNLHVVDTGVVEVVVVVDGVVYVTLGETSTSKYQS